MKEWEPREPRQKVLNNNDKQPEATLWVATHFTGKPEVILYLGKQKKKSLLKPVSQENNQ